MKFFQKQTAAAKNAVAPAAKLTKERNEYYENVSAGLGIVQVVLYLSLFAFVVLSILSNTNLITYQNFYHFFQDLNASAERVDIFTHDSVSYATDEQQSFTLYRKGLAVAGNTGVTIFSATGRQLVSHVIQYNDPVAVGSGKYLLVYERGGKQYSLYNANTQMHVGETEYPITGAAVSDSGMYALISSASDANSAVYLYNNRFALINIYKNIGQRGYINSLFITVDFSANRFKINLILGKYKFIMGAITGLTSGAAVGESMVILSVFAVGAVCGLLSFSKFLHWLLGRYHKQTLLVLAGFIIGSLVKVWPWSNMEAIVTAQFPEIADMVRATAEPVPAEILSDYIAQVDLQIGSAILFALLGFFLVTGIETAGKLLSKNNAA